MRDVSQDEILFSYIIENMMQKPLCADCAVTERNDEKRRGNHED